MLLVSDDVWNGLIENVISFGLERGSLIALVAARFSGLLLIGPLVGRQILTWPIRTGLVVLLTAIVMPQLPIEGNADAFIEVLAYSNQDKDAAGDLRSEVSAGAHGRGDLRSRVSAGSGDPRRTRTMSMSFVLGVLREVGIGAAIGLGVAIFLSGLKLAGEWFDRHSGLEMGSVLNPEFSTGGSGPAEFVSLFCVASILVLQPINGHLLVVRLILDSFQALPVGGTNLPESLLQLPGAIVQQSLILGLRIAMPFVVAMSLLDMTFGYAHRSSRWQLAPVASVFRAGASFLILAATFPGIQEAAALTLRDCMQSASDGFEPR